MNIKMTVDNNYAVIKPNPLPHVYNWQDLKIWIDVWKPEISKEIEQILDGQDVSFGTILCIDTSVSYWQGLSQSSVDYLSAEIAPIFYLVI